MRRRGRYEAKLVAHFAVFAANFPASAAGVCTGDSANKPAECFQARQRVGVGQRQRGSFVTHTAFLRQRRADPGRSPTSSAMAVRPPLPNPAAVRRAARHGPKIETVWRLSSALSSPDGEPR